MKQIALKISFVFFISIYSYGQIINVPADQPTIQSAINISVDGDTVLVADGTYFENINFKGKAITLASLFLIDGDEAHIDSTIINGSQPSHPDSGSVVFFITDENTTTVLYGFTITGGSGTKNNVGWYGAGGILVHGCGGNIQHNKIIGNTIKAYKAFGAGIVIDIPEYPTIIYRNTIANNILDISDGGGGGIFCYSDEDNEARASALVSS